MRSITRQLLTAGASAPTCRRPVSMFPRGLAAGPDSQPAELGRCGSSRFDLQTVEWEREMDKSEAVTPDYRPGRANAAIVHDMESGC